MVTLTPGDGTASPGTRVWVQTQEFVDSVRSYSEYTVFTKDNRGLDCELCSSVCRADVNLQSNNTTVPTHTAYKNNQHINCIKYFDFVALKLKIQTKI